MSDHTPELLSGARKTGCLTVCAVSFLRSGMETLVRNSWCTFSGFLHVSHSLQSNQHDVSPEKGGTYRINVSSHTIAPSPRFSYSVSSRAVSSMRDPFHTCAENARTPLDEDFFCAARNLRDDGEVPAGNVKRCFGSSPPWTPRYHTPSSEPVQLR